MISVFKPSSPVLWHWATLGGPDAPDFLHRVTTANLHSLQLGGGTQACLLTPQGRLRAYFTLWRYGETEFGLEFDGGPGDRWKTSLFSAIDELTFAEKM